MQYIVTILITLLSVCALYSQQYDFGNIQFWENCELINLETINTPDEEFSPVIWNGYMFYIGAMANQKSKNSLFFDIKCEPIDRELEINKSDLVLPLNSKYNEGPICFDNIRNSIYFTSNDQRSGKLVKNENKKSSLKIYTADYFEGKFQNYSHFKFDTDSLMNICHPTISEDGSTFIFATDDKNGMGKMDLMSAVISQKGMCSQIKSLGPKINSAGNEWFPFIYDNNHLFFASDKNDGKGLDLYYALIDSERVVSNIIRLPEPINSAADDFGIFINDEHAYISSNREGGVGKDDIYQIRWIEPTNANVAYSDKTLKVSVRDPRYKSAIHNAKIDVYEFDDNTAGAFVQQLNSSSDIKVLETMAATVAKKSNFMTDEEGISLLPIPSNRQLFIVVKKDGFASDWNYMHTRQKIESMIFELKTER